MKKNVKYLWILILIASESLLGQTIQESEVDSNAVLYEVPLKAQFPGGQDSLSAFLAKHLKWPAPDFCGQGRVIISFTVEESGQILNKTVLRSLCDKCDQEAMRIINLMPSWIPPMKNGKPIKSQILFPIYFRLE